MLNKKTKKKIEGLISGYELSQVLEKAFKENKIDKQTRTDSYAYWLIFRGHHGRWDQFYNKDGDRLDEIPPNPNLEAEVREVFEIEE